MFNVGDKIVYPMHGAGTIDSIEEKDILGEKQSYYILKMPSNVKVMVPISKAEEVGVRNLSFKQKEKGLSTGEKKMLNNAKQILVSELVLAEHATQDVIEEEIESKINTSFMTFRAEGVEQQSIVNKFIPFDSDNGATNA